MIIDRETWDRVQERVTAQAAYGSQKARPRYLLSGLLDCGICGAKMTIVGGRGQRYVCSTRHGGGDSACSNDLSVGRELAEDLILQPVVQNLLSPEAVNHAVKTIQSLARHDESVPAPRRRDTESTQRLAELRRLVQSGVLSAAEVRPAVERLQAQIEAAAVADRSRPLPEAAILRAAEEYRSNARNLRKTLKGADVVAARQALRRLIGAVRAEPTHQGSDRFLVAHYRGADTPLCGFPATELGSSRVGTVVAGACYFNFRWRIPYRTRAA